MEGFATRDLVDAAAQLNSLAGRDAAAYPTQTIAAHEKGDEPAAVQNDSPPRTDN